MSEKDWGTIFQVPRIYDGSVEQIGHVHPATLNLSSFPAAYLGTVSS